MGRYLKRLYRLLAMPEDGLSVGLMRPADSPVLVRELARMRLQELTAGERDQRPPAGGEERASPRASSTPGRTSSSRRSRAARDGAIRSATAARSTMIRRDAAGYLQHIAAAGPGLRPLSARRCRKRGSAMTPSTPPSISPARRKSGKSYLSQLLAYRLAGREKSSVWILDPHGPWRAPAPNGASSSACRIRYYFDVNLAAGTGRAGSPPPATQSLRPAAGQKPGHARYRHPGAGERFLHHGELFRHDRQHAEPPRLLHPPDARDGGGEHAGTPPADGRHAATAISSRAARAFETATTAISSGTISARRNIPPPKTRSPPASPACSPRKRSTISSPGRAPFPSRRPSIRRGCIFSISGRG